MSIQVPIDWERLARTVGALRADGTQIGGSDLALRALEEYVGPQQWRAAVDHYVDGGAGSELARSVLWLIHPWAAMEYCQEIYQTCPDPERRRAAVELLTVVADARALPWIRGYLADNDASVQWSGARTVDQLLWSHLVEPAACADLLEEMTTHANAAVRERAEWIRSFLRDRESGGAV